MLLARTNFSISLDVVTRGLIIGRDAPKTLFYLMDRRLLVYAIQLFREHRQIKLSVANKRVIALDDQPELHLRCHAFGGSVAIYLNGKLIEFSENSISPRGPYLVLVGRPFFGRTPASFLQIIRQACVASVKLIGIDYNEAPPPTSPLHKNHQFLRAIENKLVSGAAPYYEYSFGPQTGKHPNASRIARLDGVTDHEMSAIADDFHYQVFSSALSLLRDLLSRALDRLIPDVPIVTPSEAYASLPWIGVRVLESRQYQDANKLASVSTSVLETIAVGLYWSLDQSSRANCDEESLLELLEILRTRPDPAKKLADLLALCVFIRRRQFSTFINLYLTASERLCLPGSLGRVLSAYVICFGAARQRIESDGVHLLKEATRLDSEDELSTPFRSEVDTARIILSTSMLDYYFQRTQHSLRGARYHSFSTAIDKMPIPSGGNFDAILSYSLGKLAIINHQHDLASEYLQGAARRYISAQYLNTDALLMAGHVERARNEMLTLMRVSNRADLEDPFVVRYATVTNWLLGPSKYIQYASTDVDSISCVPVTPIEGLNHYSEPNVYLSNLCFCLKLRFRRCALPSKHAHIVELIGGLTVSLCEDRIHFGLGSDGRLKDALGCPLKESPGDRHQVVIRRLEKQFVIIVDSDRYVLDVSSNFCLQGGRLRVLCRSEFYADVALGLGIANPRFLRKPERKHIVIYSSWYGEEFTQLFFESLVPSLRRSDGLPRLLDAYRITWRIYTSSDQAGAVKARLEELEGLCGEVAVDTSILGSEADGPRDYLHLTFVDCVKAAIGAEAIVLFAPPDHIFGGGLFELVENFRPGGYLVCPHPRVSFERVFQDGKHVEFFGVGKEVTGKNYEYARMALGPFSHGVVQYGIAPQQFVNSRERSRWWSATVNDKRAEVSFKEPPPILFEPSWDIISAMIEDGYTPPFERVDHDIVEWVWKMKRLEVVESNDTFFWVEYCKDSRNVPTITNDYWPRSAQLLADKKVVWRVCSGA